MTSLFRNRYRITLRTRFALDSVPIVIEVDARTKATARRVALEQHDEHIVVAIERVWHDDGDARDELSERRRSGAA